uniref:G-protein coupled receptors family 1 profile domain-containing protein n=1 Tax=Nomascus leucogenys TaxID=61853 RepID=A0A2I3GLM4_NOMLE
MEKSSDSSAYGFILVGFSDCPKLEMVLFIVNFILYSVAVLGNSTIILVCILDSQLHTPMYFFLANLSFLDLCFSTSCIPQMLVNLWGPDKTQLCWLCCPAFLFPFLFFILFYYYYTLINHFLCEMPALIKMPCLDVCAVEMLAFAFAILIVLLPLTLILVSYSYIAAVVLSIKSAARQWKAFNTCSSHLTMVSLFYGSIIYMYMQPGNSSSQDQGKFLTLFYNLVTPMLNLLIYTLRNKEVKGALKKVLGRQ